jgi:hypothetical protein
VTSEVPSTGDRADEGFRFGLFRRLGEQLGAAADVDRFVGPVQQVAVRVLPKRSTG